MARRGLRHLTGSLRARVIGAATGAIIIAVALLGTAAVVFVNRQLHSSLDAALRQRAQEVALLSVSAPALLTAPGALDSAVSGRQIVVEVLDARARIIARSPALGAKLLPHGRLARDAIQDGRTGFADINLGDRPLRLYAAPIARAGGPAAGGAVLVASDDSDIANTTHHLILVLILSGLGAAALAALAAAGLTRRGLRPLRGLAEAAEEIERTGDPARRLPESSARDEIGGLTGVLNRMLAGLERSRASERRFLADASHELRTPVTTLRGNVEYAVRHGADPEILAELERDATRLARLVDDLLVLERVGEASPREDLGSQLVELDALARDASAASDRVELGPVEAVSVRGDEQSLRRAIANLIENGLVHGPAAGAVTVSVQENAGRAVLRVSDEGSGPAPADHDHLFERFWRGSTAAEQPGSGLGLAIVAAIVERHGGTVTVQGSTFSIEIPNAMLVARPQLRDSLPRSKA
ncbi:MAG: two-component system, OmpR family, sensor kinase [Solirubrobacteraceae bacterium]|jgi:signal transduction histidine kinase|nr:two-component system, OmpR family, sensor kinase [Solirubrobacteraceae bacterium]